MEQAALHALVTGRVQGVYFRAFVLQHAVAQGLRGWVRNRSDGRLEVRAEGERGSLESLLGQLETGPPGARVDGVKVGWSDYRGEFGSFEIGD
ncbi:MAG: acylphosphatase [Dehalococcoidia bacterium]